MYFIIVIFNVSISFDMELIEYDLNGLVVYIKMLVKIGIILVDEGEKLLMGLEKIC